MRRRNGEKLSLFRHDLSLPSETAGEGPGPIPEILALFEPWALTGTESERGG